MPTTYMNLTLPTVSVTAGPTYATNINDALTAIDAHDHTTGKGTQVPVAGLNINTDLPVGGFNITQIRALRLNNQSGALVGGSEIRELYSANGNLYYNNGSGVAIQITAGSGLNAGVLGGIGGDYVGSSALVSYNNTTKTYSFLQAPSTYANLSCSEIVVNGITPGIQFNDTTAAAYAYRWGVDANACVLSADTTGTRSQDSHGNYGNTYLLAVTLDGGGSPLVGINTLPSLATLEIDSATTNPLGWAYNTADAGIFIIQGNTATSGHYRAAEYQLRTGSINAYLGLLSNAGAAANGGTAGDLTLAYESSENVFVVRKTSHNVGINTATPLNKLDVSGAVAIGSYAGNNSAPSNGLIVSGAVCIGTTTNRTTTGLTVGDNILPSSAGGASLGTTSFPFQTCNVNAAAGYAIPSQSLTFYTNPYAFITNSGSVTPSIGAISLTTSSSCFIPLLLPDTGTLTNVTLHCRGDSGTGTIMTATVYQKLATDSIEGGATNIGSGTLTTTNTDTTISISLSQTISTNGIYWVYLVTGGASTASVSVITATATCAHLPPYFRM